MYVCMYVCSTARDSAQSHPHDPFPFSHTHSLSLQALKHYPARSHEYFFPLPVLMITYAQKQYIDIPTCNLCAIPGTNTLNLKAPEAPTRHTDSFFPDSHWSHTHTQITYTGLQRGPAFGLPRGLCALTRTEEPNHFMHSLRTHIFPRSHWLHAHKNYTGLQWGPAS